MGINSEIEMKFLLWIKTCEKDGLISAPANFYSSTTPKEKTELIIKYLTNSEIIKNVNVRARIIVDILEFSKTQQLFEFKNLTDVLDNLLDEGDVKKNANIVIRALIKNDSIVNNLDDLEIKEFIQKYIYPNGIKIRNDKLSDFFKKKCFDLGLGKEMWQIIDANEEEKESFVKDIILKQNPKMSEVKQIINKFNLPKDLNDELYKNIKKEIFNQKIENAKDILFDRDNWFRIGVGALVITIAGGVLGGLHHLVRPPIENMQYNKNIVSIESNIEQDINGQKFTHTAIIPVKEGDDYFVEVAGTLYNDGNKPNIFSAGYKIDEDLYNTIKKYFKVEWRFGENGQITNVGNTIRKDLEILGKAKSERAKWEIYDRIETITRENLPEYTNIINNACVETEGEIEQ